MRNKLGTIYMLLGTVLILAALSLFLWNRREAEQAGEAAADILPQVVEQIAETAAEAPAPPDPFDPTMTEVEIDGYMYIGYLSIPALGLELPVMSEWDYNRLNIAPCRYSGSTKTDDLVIAAHNFAQHFGGLSGLTGGEQVIFVDMDNVVSTYTVVAVEILAPTAVEEMTNGEYDLSLYTCTYGGRSRVTVRCDRTEG